MGIIKFSVAIGRGWREVRWAGLIGTNPACSNDCQDYRGVIDSNGAMVASLIWFIVMAEVHVEQKRIVLPYLL